MKLVKKPVAFLLLLKIELETLLPVYIPLLSLYLKTLQIRGDFNIHLIWFMKRSKNWLRRMRMKVELLEPGPNLLKMRRNVCFCVNMFG